MYYVNECPHTDRSTNVRVCVSVSFPLSAFNVAADQCIVLYTISIHSKLAHRNTVHASKNVSCKAQLRLSPDKHTGRRCV